ncbi:MAG: hypothetical protein MUE73_01375 [Planctomycetes bacterium]|jgi:hypothetical protein|nr:hypothetical protein [Planctomycetota bacterium]
MRSTAAGLAILTLLLSLPGCRIVRDTRGSPLLADAEQRIVAGRSTMDDILREFGAPDRILREAPGDLFIYRFAKVHTDALLIEEPVITNLEIFSYTESDAREDRLVVLFDRAGRVTNFGVLRGTPELD